MANLTKDQRLIKDNPSDTPHQLLLKGLSQAKYEELTAKQEKDVQAVIQKGPAPVAPAPQPVPAKTIPVVRAIPKTTQSAPIMQGGSGMAWLIDKTGKTRPLRVTIATALKQLKKYPKEFEIKQ